MQSVKHNEVHRAQTHTDRAVVSRDEWMRERQALLVKEKELTRAGDAVVKALREMPWERIDSMYTFRGEEGDVTLAQLFGKSENLIVYHMMWAPNDAMPCPSCSMWIDGLNGLAKHIAQRAALVVIARAPLERMLPVKAAKGWTVPLVSSSGNSFNSDFSVLNSPDNIAAKTLPPGYNCGSCAFWPTEDWPGISVFHRTAAGEICRTYSCHARGLEVVNAGYRIMDFLPFGREQFLPKHEYN